ncbi:hypothetical protein [Singulisphaera sp. PoT]|uniref:hypothetical protein n=1 Tax=Singulisphaera sp. PoT TaxID=3411797 RepID=UPI003BF5C0B7
MILSPEALPLLEAFQPLFTLPTYRRFVVLLLAAILTQGRHTVANPLRTVGELAPGIAPITNASSRAHRGRA